MDKTEFVYTVMQHESYRNYLAYAGPMLQDLGWQWIEVRRKRRTRWVGTLTPDYIYDLVCIWLKKGERTIICDNVQHAARTLDNMAKQRLIDNAAKVA